MEIGNEQDLRGDIIQDNKPTLTVHYETGKVIISPSFLRLDLNLDKIKLKRLGEPEEIVIDGKFYSYSDNQGMEFINGLPVFRMKDLGVIDKNVEWIE